MGQDRPGADLDEHPGAVAVHRLDRRGEPDGPDRVLAQPIGDRRAVAGIGAGVEVRVDRAVGLARPPPAARASGPSTPATSVVWNAPATGKV